MWMISSEEYIVCPNCETKVPWTPACINCGIHLPPRRRRDAESPEAAPQLPSVPGAEGQPLEVEGVLARYLLWRVRLLEMLGARKVSRAVFRQLYEEYISTTAEMAEKNRGLMEELSQVRGRIKETRLRLEELDGRRAGGRPIEGLMDEYSKLRAELEGLQADLSRIRFQQRSLGVSVGEEDPGLIGALEERLRHYLSYLPVMVSDGLLPEEMEGAVRGDLEEMLSMMEAVEEAEGDEELVEAPPAAGVGLEVEDEALLRDIAAVVKGHDDEIRRIIRALRMRDNVLILGPHGEGKTEVLLQMQRRLGGVYFHCNEEVSERELVAGFNPSAFVGENPVHTGVLMQIATGQAKGAPIAFIDAVMKLRPKTQVILFEAMNNGSFTNPVDGRVYHLPEAFSVVAASNLESVVQETPDAAFLDRFGKIVIWNTTPDDALRELLEPHRLPKEVVEYLVWMKREVDRMRYLVPISVRNLIKFAQEYGRYRDVYGDRGELVRLSVDRMLKMRVLNQFGLQEYEEARRKIEGYAWD